MTFQEWNKESHVPITNKSKRLIHNCGGVVSSMSINEIKTAKYFWIMVDEAAT